MTISPAPQESAAPLMAAAEELDPSTLRQAYACFPSGVVSVCAMAGTEPVGFVASSFTSVSMDPPLVSFCIQNDSTTWPRLEGLPRLGVSVLGEAHGVACRQLARKTGDRFAGLDVHVGSGGALFIDGASAWIECGIEEQVPAGDHRIVLLRVLALVARPAVAPLVFHGSAFAGLRQMVA